jgi:hypothetical protein
VHPAEGRFRPGADVPLFTGELSGQDARYPELCEPASMGLDPLHLVAVPEPLNKDDYFHLETFPPE